jgi:hypothetical protein
MHATDGLVIRVVLTALVFTSGRGTGIAINAASAVRHRSVCRSSVLLE